MTKRRAIPAAPEPLERYSRYFDDLFGKSNQRDEFRRYLEGLLLPTERNKTLTGLANTEPSIGAQHPRAQGMQWFLSESNWQERHVQERRLRLLLEEPSTAPNGGGVLVIDEHGDRKRGHQTAHIGKQYLANLGKLDTGVVSVTSLWADERVYYPVDFEPYTPADYFEKGKQDPQFRTKLKIGVELVRRAIHVPIPFRAVVADSFCWYHQAHIPAAEPPAASAQRAPAAQQDREELQGSQRAEGKKGARNVRTTTDLAQSVTSGQSLARTLGLAQTLLASVVSTAPTSPAPATP